jgi:hypothetical protein
LWAAAADVARWNGVNRTAAELHLDGGKLKRLMVATGAEREKAAPPSFVELVAPHAAVIPECSVELEGRRGKIRIELKGSSATDLTALSRVSGNHQMNIEHPSPHTQSVQGSGRPSVFRPLWPNVRGPLTGGYPVSLVMRTLWVKRGSFPSTNRAASSPLSSRSPGIRAVDRLASANLGRLRMNGLRPSRRTVERPFIKIVDVGYHHETDRQSSFVDFWAFWRKFVPGHLSEKQWCV